MERNSAMWFGSRFKSSIILSRKIAWIWRISITTSKNNRTYSPTRRMSFSDGFGKTIVLTKNPMEFVTKKEKTIQKSSNKKYFTQFN